jgi:hypothetical protein
MSNDGWSNLTTIATVADAHQAGWEIEIDTTGDNDWVAWGGTAWMNYQKYRGRPKQPKEVTYECYDVEGGLRWIHPMCVIHPKWVRVPEQDITVKVTK